MKLPFVDMGRVRLIDWPHFGVIRDYDFLLPVARLGGVPARIFRINWDSWPGVLAVAIARNKRWSKIVRRLDLPGVVANVGLAWVSIYHKVDHMDFS